MSVSPDDQNVFGAAQAPLLSMAPPPMVANDPSVQQLGNGDIEVSLDGSALGNATPAWPDDFNAELSVALDERTLTDLGQKVCEWVKADEGSREGWLGILQKGLDQLGIDVKAVQNFAIKGASEVTDPLVMEAAVQFQARAIEELFPSGGPAKGTVMGDSTVELQQQAERVADYLNFHLTALDTGYFEDTDQLLLLVSLCGSMFRKVCLDPGLALPTGRGIMALDFIVPYGTKNLQEAPRFTHRFKIQHSSYLRGKATGLYRDVELMKNVVQQPEGSQDLKDSSDKVGQTSTTDDDEHTFYECYAELDISDPMLAPEPVEGAGEAEEHDEIPAPYILTVDKDSMKVVGVRRNWRKGDELRRRRVMVAHYKYLPGFGFYGMGLIHLIGQLGAAATGLLRGIIDSSARANFGGGFKSKEAKRAGDMSPGLGEWKDVDLTSEELANAFHDLPYKDAGTGSFNALENVKDSGRRFASTVDVNVGGGGNSGPVGTTMALIEQANKPWSAVHKRLHNALGYELKILSELIGECLAEEYPYFIAGKSRKIMKQDFDNRVDVLPVSDPSIMSNTQRILQSQTGLQLIQQDPQLYTEKGRREAHRRMWIALKVPEYEKILVPPQQLRQDPVTENSLMLNQKPVRVFMDQDHDAHIAVHQMFLPLMPPEMLQATQPAMMAHLAEHIGLSYRVKISQQLGMPLPPPDEEGNYPALPPQLEAMIAQGVAQIASQMPALPPAAPQGQEQQPPGQQQVAAPVEQQQGAPPELQQMVQQLNEERSSIMQERQALNDEKIKSGIEQLKTLGTAIEEKIQSNRDALKDPNALSNDVKALVASLMQALNGPRTGVVQRDEAGRLAGWNAGPAPNGPQ